MENDTLRYSKQLILKGFGSSGQEKLRTASVLVVGAGGLGSPALTYLASAGIGTIGIVDFDTVTLSNLNRQILYQTPDIGKRKTEIAAQRLAALNPEIRIVQHPVRLDMDNVETIIHEYDVVIDATDNFPTRYLLGDVCYNAGKPLVEGAATGYEGILMTILPGTSPCFRCLYPTPPKAGVLPNCINTGILGMVTGVIGSMQALEAVKIILGIGDLISGRVMILDALSGRIENMNLERRKDCVLCGSKMDKA